MAAETQYTANTGIVNISTANANLDGTGTLGLLLTANAYGTLVKTITIKARQTTTTQGMIRVFIYNGTNYNIIQEIEIPANTNSTTNKTFEFIWSCDIKLKADWKIYVSTQNAESFNVFAEGLDWTYYSTAVRPESTNFTANTGICTISTANTQLDGSGTIVNALTATSGFNGTRIESITLKGLVNVTAGMIRVFIYDQTTNYLFREFEVPATVKSGSQASFEYKTDFGNYELKTLYSLKFATQNSESFAITVEANDWTYPA